VRAATAGTLSLAEPLTASLLGIVVLGERPSPSGAAGAALLAAGLALAAVAGYSSGRPTAAMPGRSLST
jgi:DME family drug/metabolite transporter